MSVGIQSGKDQVVIAVDPHKSSCQRPRIVGTGRTSTPSGSLSAALRFTGVRRWPLATSRRRLTANRLTVADPTKPKAPVTRTVSAILLAEDSWC